MIFLCRKYYLLEKKMNESVLWQDNTFNQVLALKKHFWAGKQHNFSTEIKMADIDEQIEKSCNVSKLYKFKQSNWWQGEVGYNGQH